MNRKENNDEQSLLKAESRESEENQDMFREEDEANTSSKTEQSQKEGNLNASASFENVVESEDSETVKSEKTSKAGNFSCEVVGDFFHNAGQITQDRYFRKISSGTRRFSQLSKLGQMMVGRAIDGRTLERAYKATFGLMDGGTSLPTAIRNLQERMTDIYSIDSGLHDIMPRYLKTTPDFFTTFHSFFRTVMTNDPFDLRRNAIAYFVIRAFGLLVSASLSNKDGNDFGEWSTLESRSEEVLVCVDAKLFNDLLSRLIECDTNDQFVSLVNDCLDFGRLVSKATDFQRSLQSGWSDLVSQISASGNDTLIIKLLRNELGSQASIFPWLARAIAGFAGFLFVDDKNVEIYYSLAKPILPITGDLCGHIENISKGLIDDDLCQQVTNNIFDLKALLKLSTNAKVKAVATSLISKQAIVLRVVGSDDQVMFDGDAESSSKRFIYIEDRALCASLYRAWTVQNLVANSLDNPVRSVKDITDIMLERESSNELQQVVSRLVSSIQISDKRESIAVVTAIVKKIIQSYPSLALMIPVISRYGDERFKAFNEMLNLTSYGILAGSRVETTKRLKDCIVVNSVKETNLEFDPIPGYIPSVINISFRPLIAGFLSLLVKSVTDKVSGYTDYAKIKAIYDQVRVHVDAGSGMRFYSGITNSTMQHTAESCVNLAFLGLITQLLSELLVGDSTLHDVINRHFIKKISDALVSDFVIGNSRVSISSILASYPNVFSDTYYNVASEPTAIATVQDLLHQTSGFLCLGEIIRCGSIKYLIQQVFNFIRQAKSIDISQHLEILYSADPYSQYSSDISQRIIEYDKIFTQYEDAIASLSKCDVLDEYLEESVLTLDEAASLFSIPRQQLEKYLLYFLYNPENVRYLETLLKQLVIDVSNLKSRSMMSITPLQQCDFTASLSTKGLSVDDISFREASFDTQYFDISKNLFDWYVHKRKDADGRTSFKARVPLTSLLGMATGCEQFVYEMDHLDKNMFDRHGKLVQDEVKKIAKSSVQKIVENAIEKISADADMNILEKSETVTTLDSYAMAYLPVHVIHYNKLLSLFPFAGQVRNRAKLRSAWGDILRGVRYEEVSISSFAPVLHDILTKIGLRLSDEIAWYQYCYLRDFFWSKYPFASRDKKGNISVPPLQQRAAKHDVPLYESVVTEYESHYHNDFDILINCSVFVNPNLEPSDAADGMVRLEQVLIVNPYISTPEAHNVAIPISDIDWTALMHTRNVINRESATFSEYEKRIALITNSRVELCRLYMPLEIPVNGPTFYGDFSFLRDLQNALDDSIRGRLKDFRDCDELTVSPRKVSYIHALLTR